MQQEASFPSRVSIPEPTWLNKDASMLRVASSRPDPAAQFNKRLLNASGSRIDNLLGDFSEQTGAFFG
jgi:hypothetical protein